MKTIRENWILVLISLMVVVLGISMFSSDEDETLVGQSLIVDTLDHWVAPSLLLDRELQGPERELVVYGSQLVAHTDQYFGPGGSINAITNGMNCQNCHLDAGRKAWGNNYGAVASTYPKFRDRSGSVETISKRVNDCFERSLNGQAIDTNSREMQAIVAYIKWLGKDVPKGEKPAGSGISDLAYLDRAASPENGKIVFQNKCLSCHGANGEGQLDENGRYVYPPLWGPHSYNNGAGLFRLSRFAGYVMDNMPFKQATHKAPNLSNEEAWDVAAFVNSQPRPSKDLSQDWPDISKKPIDHPFGPYTDGFSEQQHKYGPYKPIVAARKAMKEKQEELKGKTARK
jgi:thiosulfate dehydrogenase